MNTNTLKPLARKVLALMIIFTMIFTGTIVPGFAGLAGLEAYAAEEAVASVVTENGVDYLKIKDGNVDAEVIYDALSEKYGEPATGKTEFTLGSVRFYKSVNLSGIVTKMEGSLTNNTSYTVSKGEQTGTEYGFIPVYGMVEKGNVTTSFYSNINVVVEGLPAGETVTVAGQTFNADTTGTVVEAAWADFAENTASVAATTPEGYTATISINGDASKTAYHLPTEESGTVSVVYTDETAATVDLTVGEGGTATFDGSVAGTGIIKPVADATNGANFDLVATPDANYYVAGIKVEVTNKKDATKNDVTTLTTEDFTGDAFVNANGTITYKVNLKKYDVAKVDVTFAKRLTTNEAPYEVGFVDGYSASEQNKNGELKDAIVDAVVDSSVPTESSVKVEFKVDALETILGWAGVDGWIELSNDETANGTLAELLDKYGSYLQSLNIPTNLTDLFGRGGDTVTVRITYAATDKYPAATTGEVEIKLVDKRTTVDFDDAEYEYTAVDFTEENVTDFVKAEYKKELPLNIDLSKVSFNLVEGTVPAEPDSTTFKYEVIFDGDLNYLPIDGVAATIEVEVTKIKKESDVVFASGANTTDGTVLIGQTTLGENGVEVGSGEIAITVTPINGKRVAAIKVTDITDGGNKEVDIKSPANILVRIFKDGKYRYTDGVCETTFEAEESKKYAVEVEYADALTLVEPLELDYAYGADDPMDAESVFDELVKSDKSKDAKEGFKVQYKAREAGTYVVSIPEIDFGLGDALKIPARDVEVPLEELWLDTESTFEKVDSNQLVKDIQDKIAGISNWQDGLELVSYFTSSEFTAKLKYYGAHEFGEAGDGSLEQIKITYNNDEVNVTEYPVADVKIVDNRLETEITGADATVVYGFTEADLIKALGAQVTNENGVIEGAKITVVGTIELDASETPYPVTVEFKGDKDNQPSTATFNVTVNKAPCSIDYDSQVVTYGDDFTFELVKNPADVDVVQFMIGLDASKISEENPMPATSIKIQLPDSMKNIIKLLGLEDKEVSLSGLKDILQGLVDAGDTAGGILEAIGIDAETAEILLNVLNSISGSLEGLDDITITFNDKEFTPENIGIYLAGAVTADGNYETAFTADYLVIVPKTTEAEIAFNMEDDNGVITKSLIETGVFDLGATASVNGEVNSAATSQIKHLFLRLDMEGNVELVYAKNNEALKTMGVELSELGAYGQLAFTLDVSNEMYYAVPAARAYAVVHDLVNVEFVEENPVFTFNGERQPLDVVVTDKNGDVLEDDNLTVTYMGYSLNNPTELYKSEEAPVDAGVYTVIATYADEANQVYGGAITTMTIKPAEASVAVDNQNVLVGSDYDLGITVTPEDCKTINIVAGVDAKGEITDNSISLLKGTINIDFPERMDKVLKELMPSAYTTGISVNDVLPQLDKVAEKLSTLGLDEEGVNAIISVLKMVPQSEAGDVKVTFKDDVVPQNVGLYLVGAVTCDPNYTAASDLGYLLVQPKHQEVELAFNYVDANNIFTANYIKNGALDLGSHVVVDDVVTAEMAKDAERALHNLYIGVKENGEYVVSTTPSAEHGVYTQISFILDGGNMVYYAEPITRTYLVVAETVKVDFVDETGAVNNDRVFTYSGESQGMDVKVTKRDGTPVANDEFLTVRYIGYDANGAVIYDSTVAPTNVGAYTVYAIYANEEADLYGMTVGAMVIKKAKLEININDVEKLAGDKDPELTWEFVEGYGPLGDDEINIELVRQPGEKVGEYVINHSICDALTNRNYDIDSHNGTFTIKAREIKVVAVDNGKVYGEADPELTYRVEGDPLLEGHHEFFVLGCVKVEREVGEDVGEYTINVYGLTRGIVNAILNDMYNVTYVSGTFTITAAELPEAELEYNTTVFDGTAKEPTVTIDGLVEGVDFTVEYVNNTEVGTATVIVRGIGNYAGEAEYSFTITAPVVDDNGDDDGKNDDDQNTPADDPNQPSEETKDEVAKTGDETNAIVWMLVAFNAAIVGAFALCMNRLRDQK